MRPTHFLLGLSLSFVFGFGWIFGKAALSEFPPILLAGMRFGIAAILICSVMGWPKIRFQHLILLSVLAVSGPYSLSNIGLNELDVSLTVLLVQLEAPILILLSAIFLRERPSTVSVFGVLIAIAGVALVAGEPVAEGAAAWIAIVMISMFIWAAGQLWIRTSGISGSVALLGALSALATPQLLAVSFVMESDALSSLAGAGISSWLQVLYLGAVMTSLGVGIWYFLLARYEVVHVAPFLLLVPAVSIVGGILLLDEQVFPIRIIGAAIITIGVAIATYQIPTRNTKRATQPALSEESKNG